MPSTLSSTPDFVHGRWPKPFTQSFALSSQASRRRRYRSFDLTHQTGIAPFLWTFLQPEVIVMMSDAERCRAGPTPYKLY